MSIQKDLLLFGLKPSQLDKKTLKLKYLLLAKEFHPDRTQQDSSKFIEIQQSYKNLVEAIENPELLKDRRQETAQWNSREYRSKLNPNDYIQYNTGRHHSFNYKEHYRQHYQEKPQNMYKKMYYREMLERKKVNFKYGIVFLSVCVLSQTDLWKSLFL